MKWQPNSVGRLPVGTDPDLYYQRHLECSHVTHQPGQVGADFHQFGVRYFEHELVMDLQHQA